MSAPQPGDLVSVTYVARYDEEWNGGHNLTHVPSGWDLQAPPGSIVRVINETVSGGVAPLDVTEEAS